MSIVKWDERFVLDNGDLDAQHKMFVDIIGKLQCARRKGCESVVIDALLVELVKYAEFHFCSEENIMRMVDYPDLDVHREAHKKLLADLRNRTFSLRSEFVDMEQLETYLIEWLVHHTIEVDRDLSNYIEKWKVAGGKQRLDCAVV